MGITDTAKLSDVKAKYEERVKLHERKVSKYKEQLARTSANFSSLLDAYGNAKNSIVASGALTVDEDGNIALGWYKMPEGGGHTNGPMGTGNAAVGIGGSAVSIVAAIGAPAGVWTLGGIVGVASTGTAISTLSGAAATSATAAWLGGGAVSAGGLGMAAAPFVLTGIGAVVALPIFLTTGAWTARNKERKFIAAITEREKILNRAERLLTQDQKRLQGLDQEYAITTKRLIQRATILEHVTSNSGPSHLEAEEAATNLWDTIQEAERLIQKSQPPANPPKPYIEKPSKIRTLTARAVNSRTIEVTWQDPDNGESEITKYQILILVRKGFRGEAQQLGTTTNPKFRHGGLEPSNEYHYKVEAINEIGTGEASDEVSCKTPP